MEIEENQNNFEQKESIKLTKGQKGNYGWEIKILEINIDRLGEIDKKLKEKFREENELT